MNRYRIVRQEIDNEGGVHYFNEDGEEVFPAVYPVHRQRWMALTCWIIIFSFAVAWAIHQNRTAIAELHRQKANVAALVQTNYALKSFLLTACRARLLQALGEKGQMRAVDLEAARGYKQLAILFSGPAKPQCNIPKRGN